MKIIKTHSHSFLLRIWHESDTENARQPLFWRAQVQHVQSGDSCYVEELSALITFIENQTGELIDMPPLKADLS